MLMYEEAEELRMRFGYEVNHVMTSHNKRMLTYSVLMFKILAVPNKTCHQQCLLLTSSSPASVPSHGGLSPSSSTLSRSCR